MRASLRQFAAAIAGCAWSLTALAVTPWRTAYFYEPAAATMPLEAIPWSSYTHVIQYAAVPANDCTLDARRNRMTPAAIARFVRLAHAAGVKALLGLVQDTGAAVMRRCTDSAHMERFIANVSRFVQDNRYDGLDVDWENGILEPQYQGLLVGLRDAMPSQVLTVSTDVNWRVMFAAIQQDIDQINIMNYDSDAGTFTGVAPRTTWFNSAILAAGELDRISGERTIDFLLAAGVAPGKIGLGEPFYSRVIQGCRAGYPSGRTCTRGVTGPDQAFAATDGTHARASLTYAELLASVYWRKGEHLWDDTHKAAYISYRSRQATCSPPPCDADAYVSYPDARQLQAAAELAERKKLGGIMVFGLSDEYLPSATGAARYPLSTALEHAVAGWQER